MKMWWSRSNGREIEKGNISVTLCNIYTALIYYNAAYKMTIENNNCFLKFNICCKGTGHFSGQN